MDMTKDAIKHIGDTAVEAAGIKVIKPAEEPAGVYFLADRNGLIGDKRHAEPVARNHVLADLDAVVKFCQLHAPVGDQMTVWVGEDDVTVLLDDKTRRDKAKCALPLTGEVEALVEQEENAPKWHIQRAFVRLLKFTLGRALGHEVDLALKFAAVKGRTGIDTSGDLKHGSAAMSRAVQAEVTGVGALPEAVTAKCRYFEIPQTSLLNIDCAIEINPEELTFALTPRAGAILEAALAARTEIANYLTEKLKDIVSVTVLMGTP